ncbi:hypothetical protein [Nitrososphaera viennensis]|uniref:Uncharacterized protein n=2 Tax=Nitrososphaera viennensis TaxID=1034015 RepID=A0A060HL26_9ARCH|nr:hypothetical protein [Nitrososphaera viennensis]AIC17224.1 exported protein of unknown function [Nitrososphaera viennensis EN76]UVS69111.1 hypothetical protein NWT39_14550 [Nitrososphaera viennensis]
MMIARLKATAAVAAAAVVATAGIIVVAFGDIPYRMQDGKIISIAGQVVCLPHKQGLFGGATTAECTPGFKGSGGRHYALSNIEQLSGDEPTLLRSEFTNAQFRISGVFSYGATEQYRIYDIAGTIKIDSVLPISPTDKP